MDNIPPPPNGFAIRLPLKGGVIIFIFLLVCFSAFAGDNSPTLNKGVSVAGWLANAGRQPLYDRDFRQIKNVGFDNVRLPVKPELLTGNFIAVDRAVRMAMRNGLNVVLDVHPDEAFMKTLESDAAAQESFIRMWHGVAQHYKDYSSSRLVFELLNEPQYYGHEDAYNLFFRRIVAAIRQSDGSRFIIVGAPDGSSIEGLKKLKPLKEDEKILYAFHFYEPYMVTHQGVHRGFENTMLRYFRGVPYPSDMVDRGAAFYAAGAPSRAQAENELDDYVRAMWGGDRIKRRLQEVKEWADDNGVPVICGEFGVLRNHIDPASRYRWIKNVRQALEEYGIGWQLWDYTDLDGITKLIGKTSTDPIDGSVRLVEPEKGRRVIEREAVKALGLNSSFIMGR